MTSRGSSGGGSGEIPTPPLSAGGSASFPQINLSGVEKNSGAFLNSGHYTIDVPMNVDKHMTCSPTHPMFKYLLPTCVCATLALTSITPLHAQENIPPPKKTDAASDVKKSLAPTPVPLPKKQKSESATPQNENPPPTAPPTPTRKKPARTATSQPPADTPAESEATESATSSNNLPPPGKRKIAEPKEPNADAPRTLKESAPAGGEVTSPADEKQRVLAAKAARKLKPAQSASLLELINTGPATALEAVPGMDGARIKALRKARPFAEVSDLMAVSGLDPASFAAIIEWAKNGMPSPTASPAP